MKREDDLPLTVRTFLNRILDAIDSPLGVEKARVNFLALVDEFDDEGKEILFKEIVDLKEFYEWIYLNYNFSPQKEKEIYDKIVKFASKIKRHLKTKKIDFGSKM